MRPSFYLNAKGSQKYANIFVETAAVVYKLETHNLHS